MVKIAASAAIKAHIPTRPRVGSIHSSSVGGRVKDVVFITFAPSLVLPVRVFRVLKVPERATALNRWNDGEVVCRRRRTSGPFESPRIPGIVSSGFATVVGPEQVSQEDQDPGSLKKNPDGDNEVPGVPTTPRLVGVDPSRHAQQSWDMHEVEGEMEAN